MKFPIVDGNSRHTARIVYGGKENIKADNDHKYRCLRLTIMNTRMINGVK